jgi:hypothetical protein
MFNIPHHTKGTTLLYFLTLPNAGYYISKSVLWIHPDSMGVPGSVSAIWIRIQEGKYDPQKKKKINKFHFLSAGCSVLRAEGFSCSLDVLYGGLGINKLQFFYQKKI